MVTYYLHEGHYTKEGYPNLSKKPFAKVDSIKKARVRSVNHLLKLNKPGRYVTICDENGYEIEGVGLFYDTSIEKKDNCPKPTVGLREGYKFTTFDGNKSRIILKDGSLGREPNW